MALTVLALLACFLRAGPARAAEEPAAADRSSVVTAWRMGGTQVKAAAEVALVGSDDQVREFLDGGWQQAQRLDERDAVAAVISDGGPAVRAAAKQALDAADAGDQSAIATFLSDGWQGPSDIDARLSVNQLMAVGGPQVRQAAQQALDSEDPEVLQAFLESDWQVQWLTDQRLRVNQAMDSGGPRVRAAAQKALDAGTAEALEQFLEYGWAVASAQDEETATLTDLLAQAKAAGEVAEQETRHATEEADRAKAASEAARRAAAEAAQATAAAGKNTAQAAAHAKRAAVAAEKAAQAAKVAVQAAAAASRAARAASTAAARAASAASRADQAASAAYKAAADAATDETKAANARRAAEAANAIARETRDFATKAEQAGKAIEAGLGAVDAAKSAAQHAKDAADANDEAARHAKAAGADASQAVAAAQRARANADRAVRAAQAAEEYLRVAIDAAYAARDAARRAADNAEAAAQAAIDAAEHAGESAEAARRATEHAEAATVAAQDAVDVAVQAVAVFEAAREADAQRLAVARDQGLEAAQAANTEYEAQQRIADWDIEQAAQRDGETNRLITEAQNPDTPPETAVAAGRRVALALSTASGVWTREAALAALAGSDEQVLAYARTGITTAAAQDDRQAVMDLAITDNTALAAAAQTALAGSAAEVTQFLRTQNYPGRHTQDRLKVNQILAAARTAGDVVLQQKAQEALDAETLQALRDFLDTGQYTAAAVGERVRVNHIMADPDSGPEIKAAAQIALDGPPAGLREFLETGRYVAAERDHDSAVHLAVVAGLLEKINQVAETAVQNALEAQAVAARARGDAEQATNYANDAARSAQKAAEYASNAQGHANQAAQSAEKAAAAVQTAKNAATRANASARSAIRSAAWAISSHHTAIEAASSAHAAAQRAYTSAINAGDSAEAAIAAAQQAFDTYTAAQGLEIAKCHTEYASGPAPDLERLLSGTNNEWYRNCVANVISEPAELANRAYTNAAFCTIYPQGSQLYQNCIHSTLDPAFRGMQPLIFIAEVVKGLLATLIPVGITAGALCVATVVCGTALGTLLTIADVGLNIHKLINGDQSLAQTLINLGQTALESLLLAGVGKVVTAGFQSVKALYIAAQTAKKAQTQLEAINLVRLAQLEFTSCLRRSFAPATLVAVADGSHRDINVGDLVLGTDPTSGQMTSEPGTRLWRNHDTTPSDVEVTDHADVTSTIHTSDTHPFWPKASNAWSDAATLVRGSRFHTLTGAPATASSVRTFASSTKVMYDLTATNVHSYYAAAGSTAVLPNNASCIELTDLGGGWYETPAKLFYGPGSKHGHRIFHVLAHGYPDPTKAKHTVFFLQPGETILGLIDEAWLMRAAPDLVRTEGARTIWFIPMNRQVGTAGERHVCIVVQNLDELITAFPSANPECE
ncbi:polymorphic toxin-type HINT domain-containing protein [Streptomyces sp. NPDC002845]